MPKCPTPEAPLPTRQLRSQLTQERILAATEALLAEGDADLLTMEAIAERAHVSIGAFYKRFQGKTSLLPLVLERVQDQHLQRLRTFLAQPCWQHAGLALRAQALLEVFAESQIARHRLIRSLVVGHMRTADPGINPPRSSELIGLVRDWLSECAAEIDHPEPHLALSLGLYTTLQTLQTAILFDRVPPEIGLTRFTAELARMLLRYLGVAEAPAPHTGS